MGEGKLRALSTTAPVPLTGVNASFFTILLPLSLRLTLYLCDIYSETLFHFTYNVAVFGLCALRCCCSTFVHTT